MSRFIDLSGQKFGRWTVISYAGKGKWNCKCLCGTEKVVRGTHMKSGASKSCGCYGHDVLIKRNTIHGQNKTPIHYLWLDINKRCNNTNYKQFKDYGGRGIRVCDEWRKNFVAFRDWCLSNGYEKGLTIDRIDNDKGYSPDNCRFVGRIVQNNNKRSNHKITVDGKTKTIMQWSREFCINESVIRGRLRRGWSEEDAVRIPLRTFSRSHSYEIRAEGA